MKNLTLSQYLEVSEDDLKEFSPLLHGWSAFAFVSTTLIVSAVAALVQRAVHLTLRKIGHRNINIIAFQHPS